MPNLNLTTFKMKLKRSYWSIWNLWFLVAMGILFLFFSENITSLLVVFAKINSETNMIKSTISFIGLGFLLYSLPAIAYQRLYSTYSIDINRIEATHGILQKRSSTAELQHIRSVDVTKTLMGMILDYGTILIGTAGTGDSNVIIEGVDSPDEIKVAIRKLINGELPDQNLNINGNPGEQEDQLEREPIPADQSPVIEQPIHRDNHRSAAEHEQEHEHPSPSSSQHHISSNDMDEFAEFQEFRRMKAAMAAHSESHSDPHKEHSPVTTVDAPDNANQPQASAGRSSTLDRLNSFVDQELNIENDAADDLYDNPSTKTEDQSDPTIDTVFETKSIEHNDRLNNRFNIK